MICRLCDKDTVEEVIDFGNHPITKYLLVTQNQCFDTYPIVLCYCNNCSFIQLRNCISPEILYGQQVNLSSWKNQPHIPQILDIIANLSGINHQSKILEIGCNDGSFLGELQYKGYKNLIGIDPSAPDSTDNIKYYKEYFSPVLDYSSEGFDLIIARHVLEHVEKLNTFGSYLKTVCSKKTGYLLIEVPDFGFNLHLSDYSGVWEEHVNYFTEHTLRRYLSNFGIEVLRYTTFEYSGRSLLALCMFTNCKPIAESWVEYGIRSYHNNWPQYKRRLRIALENCNRDIVVYGAGCRATSLINYTEIGDLITFVVDDQPEKQKKFLSGSRLPIYSSEELYNGQVGTCLLAVNSENEEKVVRQHPYFSGEFNSLLPLSRRIISI